MNVLLVISCVYENTYHVWLLYKKTLSLSFPLIFQMLLPNPSVTCLTLHNKALKHSELVNPFFFRKCGQIFVANTHLSGPL